MGSHLLNLGIDPYELGTLAKDRHKAHDHQCYVSRCPRGWIAGQLVDRHNDRTLRCHGDYKHGDLAHKTRDVALVLIEKPKGEICGRLFDLGRERNNPAHLIAQLLPDAAGINRISLVRTLSCGGLPVGKIDRLETACKWCIWCKRLETAQMDLRQMAMEQRPCLGSAVPHMVTGLVVGVPEGWEGHRNLARNHSPIGMAPASVGLEHRKRQGFPKGHLQSAANYLELGKLASYGEMEFPCLNLHNPCWPALRMALAALASRPTSLGD